MHYVWGKFLPFLWKVHIFLKKIRKLQSITQFYVSVDATTKDN